MKSLKSVKGLTSRSSCQTFFLYFHFSKKLLLFGNISQSDFVNRTTVRS